MKVFLFYAPKDIRYEEVTKPSLEDGEVLVQIKVALTGGTDVKTYERGHPRIIKTIPSSFGYEFSGIISQSRCPEFSLGMPVVSANTAPCYECFFCTRKEFSLCENLDFLNGSFAEYIKIPKQIVKYNLYQIPQGLSFKEAAATQTLAVALHGYTKTQIKDGDTVVIYGLGAIGQCFIKLCKKLNKDIKVIAIGRSQFKLDLARNNGADYIVDAADAINIVKKITGDKGADKAIEAVGKPEVWSEVLNLVRPGGLINYFGGCPKDSTIELSTYKIHYQEITITGTFHHEPQYMERALKLISERVIDMNDLISHEMPLSDLEKALALMKEGKALKVCVAPSF